MPNITTNKKVLHNYHILEKFEAGLVLNGREVKSAKSGNINLAGSYISLDHHPEAWLVGCHIAPYKHAGQRETSQDPARPKKLLLSKKELVYLVTKSRESGLTILPLSVYTKGSLVKLEIGVARGKKKYDKRESIKKRTIEREIGRRLKR